MNIKEMSTISFPKHTMEEWEKKSEESLKGKKIDSLWRNTYENIQLKPLYTKADQREEIPQFPAQSDFRRGVNPLGTIHSGWEVAQEIRVQTATELKERLHEAFKRGQTAISFEVKETFLPHLASIVSPYHEKHPYSVNGKQFFGQMIEMLPSCKEASGYIAQDILALYAEYGAEEDTVEKDYDRFYQSMKQAKEKFPHVKMLLVDTTPYHNGGANAVQELAIAMSTGVFHVQQLSKRGLSPDEIASEIVFYFSIGTNFFMELAKFRAVKILWGKILEAYGIDLHKVDMILSARTSHFTKTVFDPYVNMLRAGSEAFAAVLGGIHYLHVSPFNEPESFDTAFSDRIARNTQLILKEEAHLTKTIDPAGGSWYVEKLTESLAEKAWELFLQIEDEGGMLEALKKGWIQQNIASVRQKRKEAIFTRKQVIVGTNKYANLQDEPLHMSKEQIRSLGVEKSFIAPIPQERLSEPYERLRFKAMKLEKEGKNLTIGLITLGKLKEHKTRSDFIAGFFAPGGIKTVCSGEIETIDKAFAFIKETNFKYYCLCGSDEKYAEKGLEFVQKIKNKFPHLRLYLAGKPEQEEKWLQEGIEKCIHMKSSCFDAISSLLTEMEEEKNE